jgi:hypothetical protein
VARGAWLFSGGRASAPTAVTAWSIGSRGQCAKDAAFSGHALDGLGAAILAERASSSQTLECIDQSRRCWVGQALAAIGQAASDDCRPARQAAAGVTPGSNCLTFDQPGRCQVKQYARWLCTHPSALIQPTHQAERRAWMTEVGIAVDSTNLCGMFPRRGGACGVVRQTRYVTNAELSLAFGVVGRRRDPPACATGSYLEWIRT